MVHYGDLGVNWRLGLLLDGELINDHVNGMTSTIELSKLSL